MSLAVDRAEIARFVNALFCDLDPWGFVSMRAFRQFPLKGEPDRPLHIEAIRLNLGLEPVIDAAERIALRVGNGGEPGVFAPPICSFIGRTGAKASEVHEAPVLSVECDQGDLERIADSLSLILGERPTIALHSGSLWADPATGELLPKGHLHWRLSRPARGPEPLRMLRRARDIATLIAGGDPTGTPMVHPLRWPGSWNRKSDPPVVARIVEANASAIDLTEALAALEDAAEAANLAAPRNTPHLLVDDLPAELAELAGWLTFYTTAHLPPAGEGLRHEWNKVAMAIHRATGGSEEGFRLFREWSAAANSPFYTEAGCRRRWDAITGCPPTWIGARFIRRMAIAHGWTPPGPEHQEQPRPDPEPPPEAPPPQSGWPPEPPPRQREDKDFVLPIEFSENHLSYLFSSRHQDRLVYVHGWGKWFRYHGGRWHEDHAVRVYDAARAICAEEGERARHTLPRSGDKVAAIINKAACVAAIERLARHHESQTRDRDLFDADQGLVNGPGKRGEITTRPNGMSMILGEHRREDYCTRATTIDADPNADCPLWKAFLLRIMGGDQDMVDYLQRVCGYCLTGFTKEHAMFFGWGTGSNGKSTFSDVLIGILGTGPSGYAAVAPVSTFLASQSEQHPTDLAMLQGVRLVIAQETEQGRSWATSKLKMMTGGDRITAQFMRQDFFTYVPRFKIMVLGNHKPSLGNVDEAIRRRLHLIPFTVTIPEKERDQTLPEKLKAEYPAILWWMMRGCQQWHGKGLDPPAKVRGATASYLATEDNVANWITDRCILGKDGLGNDGFATLKNLFASWKSWCEANGDRSPGPSKQLAKALDGRPDLTRHQTRTRQAGWKGIRLPNADDILATAADADEPDDDPPTDPFDDAPPF